MQEFLWEPLCGVCAKRPKHVWKLQSSKKKISGSPSNAVTSVAEYAWLPIQSVCCRLLPYTFLQDIEVALYLLTPSVTSNKAFSNYRKRLGNNFYFLGLIFI